MYVLAGVAALALHDRQERAEMLPRFLEHARGLWDELVVVDTGSTDGTQALLHAAGARVLERAWDGSFAAARNFGLDAAAGDFCLVLDPDELASAALSSEARERLADEQVGAATLRVQNTFSNGTKSEARLLRIFRNAPEVRYEHTIHEVVDSSVQAHLERTGRRLIHLEAPVVHLGYEKARATARGKRERDRDLLNQLLSRDPTDLYAHFKRLEQARFWGDRDALARAAREVEGLLAPGARLASFSHGGELLVLVAEGLYERDPRRASEWLAHRSSSVKASAALELRRGELAEVLGHADEAEQCFRRALSLEASASDPGLASVRPRLGLARLALARADFASARAEAETALPHSPRDLEALLLAVTLARAAGGRSGAQAFAAEHARRFGESAELLEALGESALLSGDAEVAVPALLRASGEPPRGKVAVRLATALLACGELAAARGLALTLFPAEQSAGLVTLLCDLVEGRDSSLALDLSDEEAERSLKAMLGAVRAVGHPDVVALLTAAAPAVAGPFPWFAEALAGSSSRG